MGKKQKVKPESLKTQKRRVMLSWKCAVCDSKKSRFIKKQEASRLLSNLGLRTGLSKIALLGTILL